MLRAKVLEAEMISCTEFIPAYSELFKFLDQHDKLVDFWHNLADNFLENLRVHIEKEGLAGCYNYWSHTLTEEAADFSMELDEEKGVFHIDMRYCPSMGRLLESKHLEPFSRYCDHCDHLYQPLVEQFGFIYKSEIDSKHARCKIWISRPQKV